MDNLDYFQTLERVERFMEASGFRKYCTEICRGRCCGGCYTSEGACHKNEGRRLACSIFVCSLIDGDGAALMRPFLEMSRFVEHEVAVHINALPGRYDYNIYRQPPPDKLFSEFSLPMDDVFIAGTSLEYATELKELMDALTKHVKRFRMFPMRVIDFLTRLGILGFKEFKANKDKKDKWVIRWVGSLIYSR